MTKVILHLGPNALTCAAMADLALVLFGAPQLVHAHRGEVILANRKALALLAYLAVNSERPHSRETLLGLLWPNMPDADARNNLRVVWAQLIGRVGQDDNGNAFLLSSRLDLRVNLESALSIDVVQFAKLLADCATHAHPQPHRQRNACPECQARLAQAVALYRGEFLAGHTLNECPDFDEWQMMWRERLHLQVIEALDDLVQFHAQAGQPASAEGYARRQIELDPLRESAYRQLMQLLDQQGQRSAALEIYERCRQVLKAEMGVEPEPETRALAEKIREHAIEAQPANPNNLPNARTTFLGRAQEVVVLAQQLQAAPAKVITLTGSGGVGKSRLALQIGRTVLPNYADGVWLVELASISDAQSVARAFVAALEVREQAGVDLLQTLTNFVQNKQLVLIVDNCEHVREACAGVIAHLHSVAPALRVLATSRVALQVEGEQLYRVPSLSFPTVNGDKPIAVESLLGYEAIQMFVQRARAALPDFALSASNAIHVQRICRRLDGIALALELAAARLNVMPIEAIAERLERNFALLSGGAATTLPRHRTLHASIDWSYNLLPEAERALLRQLSVFNGGWSLEAVEYLGLQSNQPDVLDLLFNLVNHSLVIFGEDRQHQRYGMLEGIRQYVQAELRAHDEVTVAQTRHAQFYITLIERAAQLALTPDHQFALTAIDREYENIASALDWASRHAPELGVQLAAPLGEPLHFWELRGHFADGRRYLGQLLDALREHTVATRAKLMMDVAWLERAQPNYAKTLEYARASLQLSEALGDATVQLTTRLFIVDVVTLQDPSKVNVDELQACLARAEQLAHKPAIAYSLYLLGSAYVELAAPERARDYFERSVAVWREVGDKLHLADALNYLAAELDAADLLDDALALYDELEGIYREMGYERGLALMQNNVGCIWVKKGEYERAKALFVSGLHVRRKLGLQRGYLYSLLNFADLAVLQGQHSRAVQLFGAADALRERLGLIPNRTDLLSDAPAFDQLKQALGDRRYNMEWTRGRNFTTEQALELALERALERPLNTA